nr:DUF2079 domain-containing protein [Thermococcus sp. LS1]
MDIDLFIFAESFRTTLQGEGFFFNTNEWQTFGAWSHFGVHNSPILILLLPIYALFPSYYTLIILQDLIVPISAIILFKFATEVLDDGKKALVVSVVFLMNPLLHGTIRYTFHPSVFGIPFMLLFAYYMARNELKKAFIAALFVLSVREDAGLFLIAYALFDVLRKHECNIKGWFDERHVINFAMLGLGWMAVSVFLVIPYFNIAHKYPFFGRYEITEVTLVIFEISLAKLIVLLLSVAFVPLRRYAYWIPIILLWLENAIANKIQQAMIGFHYDYMVLPMTFIVLVYALKEDETVNLRRLVFSAMISMLLFSPMFRVINTEPVSLGTSLWEYMAILWG